MNIRTHNFSRPIPRQTQKESAHNRISTDAQFLHTDQLNVRHRKAVCPTECDNTVARHTADIRPC